MHIFVIVLVAVAVLGGIVTYGVIINAYLAAHAAATAKAATVASSTGLAKIGAMLTGWKTIICTTMASLFGFIAAIPGDTVTAWGTLPWASIIDQKTAAIVTILFSLVGGLFHAQGVAKAAATPPQN